MVGSAILVLPQNFLKGGFLMSFIVMTIIGLGSYYTCRIILKMQKEGETDLSGITKRVLGERWQ